MTPKRVLGFVATLGGWLLLALAAIGVGLLFYYRPNIEYAYVENHQRPLPSWLNRELLGGLLGTLLALSGGLLLWAGWRWRRA